MVGHSEDQRALKEYFVIDIDSWGTKRSEVEDGGVRESIRAQNNEVQELPYLLAAESQAC